MFDAGTAIATLTGRVIREPFQEYGRLVDVAESHKEHRIALGADVSTAGFDKMAGALETTKQRIADFSIKAKAAFDSVTRSTVELAAGGDRELGTFRKALVRTAEAFGAVTKSSRDTTRVVVSEEARMATAAQEAAAAKRAAADSWAASDAKIAESSRIAAGAAGGGGGRGYVNPVVTGGGGGGDGTLAASEQQARKTTAAWKAGFATLAGLGKWASLGILGVGGISLKVASDFQKQMELVHTQAGYSQQEVDKLRRSVLQLAPAVGVGPTKLAQGLFHIASSGVPAAHAMEVLKIAAEGAKVGNADLEAVTNALVAIMRTAPKDINSVGEAMGVLNDIVGHGNLRMEELTAAMGTGLLAAGKAVGLGLRDVGAALDTMTSRGIPAQEGATRLRTVLGLVANPTQKAQKALDELGFSHNRLAIDFRQKGLVGALTDLQGAMAHVFGHKLDAAQEAAALQAYAQRLQDAGASTNTIRKDLIQYKHELDQTGGGAIKASQLIATAFGGARMGTTMQILMQNVDDVRKHFNQLNEPGAAQRFQKDWQATEKNFSEQAAKLWAGVQRLAIGLGDYLIPKVEALVKWLIEAGKWMGHHKALAEALAYAFGTLLVAAIAAFFARFIAKTAEGIKSIGSFGKAIFGIPKAIDEATARVAEKLRIQQEEWAKTATAAEEAIAIINGEVGPAGGTPVAGGPGGALGDVPILGMINGIIGVESPGSKANPIAVFVVDSAIGGGIGGGGPPRDAKGRFTSYSQSATAAGRTVAAEEEAGMAAGGKVAGEEIAAAEAAGGKVAAAEIGAAEIGGGAVGGAAGRLRGAATSVGSRAAGAGASIIGAGGRLVSRLLPAGIGVLLAQQISSFIPGAVGHALSKVATGAAIGSIFGPWGTALGGALGLGLALFTSHSKSDGEKWADRFTSSLPGKLSDATKKGLAHAASTPIPKAPGAKEPGPGNYADPAVPGIHLAQAQVLQAQQSYRQDPTDYNYKRLQAELKRYNALFNSQFNAMFNAAFKFGNKTGSAFIEGMKKVKVPSEFAFQGQMMKALSEVPKNVQAAGPKAVAIWRDQAAKEMLSYATSLEKNGKLPKGAVDNIIASLETKFGPKFQQSLQRSGISTERVIAQHMKFDQARKNLENFLNDFRTNWDFTWQFAKTTNNNIYQNTGKVMSDLRLEMKSKSKAIRQEASKEMQLLQQNVAASFDTMLKDTGNKMDKMSALIQSNNQDAAHSAKVNYDDFVNTVHNALSAAVITTGQAYKMIAEATNQLIKAFGGNQIPVPALVHAQQLAATKGVSSTSLLNPGAGTVSKPKKHAGGGVLPGGEFGHNDAMTLVDPMGNARAKMAGDEWVFSKHQAPYVDMGLRMLGFGGAQDLWNTVNRPHGYAQGGALGKAANYVFPFTSNTTIGRTDQGIDANMPVGSPIGPVGKSKILGRQENWYAGQPYIWWQLLDGPKAGTLLYLAEQITNVAPVGSVVQANQAVARYAGSGTGIEYGFAAPAGQTLAQAQGNTGDASHGNAPAGIQFRNFLMGLAHGKILGGGFTGISHLDVPKIKGHGLLSSITRNALKKMTGAANSYLDSQAGNASGAAGATFSGTFKATKGGWYTMGATEDTASQYGYSEAQFAAHQGGGSSNYHGGMSFAELLEAGANAGKRPDMTQILGLPRGSTGMPYGTAVDFRMPGGSRAATGIKSDVGSGQPNLWFKADLHQRLAQAIGWHPNQDIQVKRHASGGALRAFAGGGGAPGLPNLSGWVPGYRPIRVRRGKGGLHVTGGGSSRGPSRGSSGSSSRRTSKGPKRSHQHLSQTAATVLDSLGLGSFVDDQNLLGRLDQQYTQQESLFNTFDGASGSLPVADLDVLMGIREQEWDILYKEHATLPSAIAKLSEHVDHLQGHHKGRPIVRLHPTHKHDRKGIETQPGKPRANPATGVTAISDEITHTENEITSLQHELTRDSHKISTIHHNVTGAAMALAEKYASQTSTLLGNLTAIHDERYSLSQQRLVNRQQLLNLTVYKGSSTPSITSIVNQVMAGATGTPPSQSAANAPAKKRLHQEVLNLARKELTLSEAAYTTRQAVQALGRQRAADALKLRKQGFDEAWALQLQRWKIQDKITRLKESLAKLKESLRKETAKLKPEQSALTELEGWQSGGLQGTESIDDSLGAVGQEILDLYQSGADLPTPGRKGPTLQTIEDVLQKVLGLTIPSGISGGQTLSGAAAMEDFTAFQADRATLFSQFGSNFVPAGARAFGSPAALGAGRQYYGAAGGSGAGVPGSSGFAGGGALGMPRGGSGPGSTTYDIDVTQHFAAGPPDPHTYAQGLGYELRAAM